MFKKLKEKINLKIKLLKKAAFLAFIGYLYDKVANRKRGGENGKYIQNIEYEVRDENKDNKA